MIPLRDSQPSYGTPAVTIGIIVMNVLVFLYQITLDPLSLTEFVYQFGMIPARFQPEDMLTSMFLHGGWMHILSNMWFLWIYGDNVEDILGHGKYVLFYLLCGLAAALVQWISSPGSRLPTIGASGAIAGIMGAYLARFPKSTITVLVPMFFLFTVDIPAVIILGYWFVLQIFSGFGEVGRTAAAKGGTAWFAHIGGFVCGYLLIRVFHTKERYWRRPDLRW